MGKYTFDATDWKIVDLLAQDGRITAKAIAQQLDLAEATIRNRLNRLISSGKLKVAGLINHDAFEDKVVAFVAVVIQEARNLDAVGQRRAAANDLRPLVSIASGGYDFLIEILVSSNKGIIQFLQEELSTIEGIGKTETHLILKSFNKWVSPA